MSTKPPEGAAHLRPVASAASVVKTKSSVTGAGSIEAAPAPVAAIKSPLVAHEASVVMSLVMTIQSAESDRTHDDLAIKTSPTAKVMSGSVTKLYVPAAVT